MEFLPDGLQINEIANLPSTLVTQICNLWIMQSHSHPIIDDSSILGLGAIDNHPLVILMLDLELQNLRQEKTTLRS